MIHSLNLHTPSDTPIGWLGEVATLKKPREFSFKPGLNVLWGRNGSGKTTILKLLATLLHCEQGGRSIITQDSISALCDRVMGFGVRYPKLTRESMLASLTLKHDGQSTRHFNPEHAKGLSAGGAAFDWEFGMEGIQNAMFKGSSGQTTMRRLSDILADLHEEKPVPAVEDRTQKHMNDIWMEKVEISKLLLKGEGKKGPPTLLMDEPERSFDLPLQVQCWRFIRVHSAKNQIIVASHSPFALNIPEATYHEMEPGYLDVALKSVALLSTWADETPMMIRRPAKEEKPAEEPKKAKGKRAEAR